MQPPGLSAITDYFALLDEPRRFWLDPEALKQKFMARSADVHPDHSLSRDESTASTPERFTALNAAYQCLRNPRTRLQHLIELETGTRPQHVDTVPQGLTDLFFRVAQKCRQADALLSRKSNCDSPLLQVEMFEANQDCVDQLLQVKQQIGSQMEGLFENLRRLDEQWLAADLSQSQRLSLLSEAGSTARLLGYFERWSGQLQERMFQLTL